MVVGKGILSTIGAGLIVLISIGALVWFSVWPIAVSVYRRRPGLRFPRQSLRGTTVRKETQENGWQWLGQRLLQDKQSLWTYWSFLWVVPAGIAVIVAFAVVGPSIAGRVQPELIQHSWQAQLTITSFSFIVLIFLLEQMSRAEYREGVIQEFFSSTRIMPMIYFALGSSGFMAYLYIIRSSSTVTSEVVDATFITFLGTILGIGYVYYRVARLIFFDPLDEITVAQIQRGIDLQIRDKNRQTISNTILEQQLPEPVKIDLDRDGRLYTAQKLGLDGYIVDINLTKLTKICEGYANQFEDEEIPELYLNLQLGAEMQPGIDVVSTADPEATSNKLTEEFATDLADAIYYSDDRPWRTGDRLVERNMGRIRDETQDAINDLSPVRLEKYLGLYINLLHHAVQVNCQRSTDLERTPASVSTLISQIYRELYHILEGAAKTGSSDLINTARGNIFRLALTQHRQQESHLFSKSIGLYTSYYRLLAASPQADPDLISGVLSSINDVRITLSADLVLCQP